MLPLGLMVALLLGRRAARIVGRLGSRHVSEATHDVELLARALVALNRQGELLREIGGLFAAAGHELYLVGGSVRDAVLGRLNADLDFTTDARPETVQRIVRPWADALWDTGIDFGTVGVGKGGRAAGDHHLPRRQLRPGVAQPAGHATATGSRTIWCAATSPSTRWRCASPPTVPATSSTRSAGSTALRQRILDTPAAPEVSFGDDPLRMLRAARFVSQLQFDVSDRVRRAIVEMAPQLGRITVERVAVELDKLLLGADPVAGLDLMVQTGHGRGGAARDRRHADGHRRAPSAQGRLPAFADGAAAGDGARQEHRDGPDLVLRWAALLHDIGKPATRRHEPDGGVSFHHHEVVGAKMVRKRMRALKYSKQMIDDVSQLVYLHLRFHGYGDGKWTDSAVRRYVTDAGPLLPRLHKLVRADCTTRNKRRAARLQANYDDLETRIAELAAKEDLARVRPDLDGNAIMRLLGIPPGPQVGQAWNFLKELRLDRGPLDHDDAVAELLAWWNAEADQPGV